MLELRNEQVGFGEFKIEERRIIMSEDRYKRGLERMKEIDGESGEPFLRSVESVKDASPDMARYVVEFVWGDVLSRPGLDIKYREIAAVAALTALGGTGMILKTYISGALNVGWSREEITECILQTAVYAGFPKAVNGMFTAKEVFKERDEKGLN